MRIGAIEKGVPLAGLRDKYKLSEFKTGDMRPYYPEGEETPARIANRLQIAAARVHQGKSPGMDGWRFSIRIFPDAVRVWRLR